MTPAVLVIDVGSPAKGNMGWWALGPDFDYGSTSPTELISTLVRLVQHGPLLLGFEAPMYVPANRPVSGLLKSRPGEGSRVWSVAAGATTATVSLALVPWVFKEMVANVPGVKAWQDWSVKPARAGEVLVFEAFVSGGSSDGHAADARAAAVATVERYREGDNAVSALDKEPCFSLLGAALLREGLSVDIKELRQVCMVVRAAKSLAGSSASSLLPQ